MCESINGIHPIMSFIHKRKLFFFQKLCMLDNNYLSKRIFLIRLFSFLIDPHRRHYGYIPDIIDILRTYGLIQYLTEYIDTGSFPSKSQWKSIVHKTVNEQQSVNWLNRIALDDNFMRFRNIHKTVSMTNFWKKAQSFAEIRNSYFITKLLADIPNSSGDKCVECENDFSDVYVHACCSCICTLELRELWWGIIIENFPLQLYSELSEYDDEEIYQILLGRIPLNLSVEHSEFERLCHAHVFQCLALYGRCVRLCNT